MDIAQELYAIIKSACQSDWVTNLEAAELKYFARNVMKYTWYRNTRAGRMDSPAEFRRQLILTEPTSAQVSLKSLLIGMKA